MTDSLLIASVGGGPRIERRCIAYSRRAVADGVVRGVVVAPVVWPEARAVEVDRPGGRVAWIGDPVDAAFIRQQLGDIATAPVPPPAQFQAGVVRLGTVVEATVAFLLQRPGGAVINAPT